MSSSTLTPTSPAERLAAARERLEPLFERIAEGVVERGGDGLDLPDLAELLVDLATADSHLPQVFRGHTAWVEHLLSLPDDSPYRERWLRRVAQGEIVGNAWSETGGGVVGQQQTVVEREDGRWLVTGRTYSTTGTILADWADATARRLVDGSEDVVTVLVRTGQPGVVVRDDRDGFGQQLTGTGTLVLTGAVVDEQDIAPFEDRSRYQAALHQLVLLAVHAGIAAAVERDTASEVRARTRTHIHGLAPLVRDDPQVQAVAGEVSAIAFTARQLVGGAAEAVQGAADTAHDRDSAADREANVLAEIRTAQAQVVLCESVPAVRVGDRHPRQRRRPAGAGLTGAQDRSVLAGPPGACETLRRWAGPPFAPARATRST